VSETELSVCKYDALSRGGSFLLLCLFVTSFILDMFLLTFLEDSLHVNYHLTKGEEKLVIDVTSMSTV
jgi:hypothetical protein